MKARRQAKILELIRTRSIETQEDLAAALGEVGIPVTQATISRDIKELQLNKVPTGDGHYRYALPEEATPGNWDKRRRLLIDSVLGVDSSENIIVVRALQGTAANVAYAIDYFAWPEVIGTVAGEDTVLIVVKPKEATPAVLERIQNMLR